MIKITIAGKEYQASPLRLKQLRQISQILSNPQAPKTGWQDVERWLPFVLDCLKVYNPDITNEVLDEMTIQEFTDGWKAIAEGSSVQLNKGETKPTDQTLTGNLSTLDSQVPSAGATA